MIRNGNWLRGAPGVWPTPDPPAPSPSPAEQAFADIQVVLDAYRELAA